MEQLEIDWHSMDFGNPQRGILPVLADEVGRLEKEWDLV